MTKILKANIVGTFQLTSENGSDLTPKSARGKGLIALLIASPRYRRSRKWLQAMLWSDKNTEKSSRSLRQCIFKTRQELGRHADFISASRDDVWLKSEYLDVDYGVPPIPSLTKPDLELFEGLDIDDIAFEDWIRLQRQEYDSRHLRSPSATLESIDPAVYINRTDDGTQEAIIFGKRVVQELSYSLRDHGGIKVFDIYFSDIGSQGNVSSSPIEVSLYTTLLDDGVFLSVDIRNPFTNQKYWSSTGSATSSNSLNSSHLELEQIVSNAIDQVLRILAKQHHNTNIESLSAASLCAQALRQIFKLDKNSLALADSLLSRAYEIEPLGQYLAWRAFIRNISFFQHRSVEYLKTTISLEELCIESLRHSPDSSIVQTIASQFYYINESNVRGSLDLAEEVVEQDSLNPLAWAILSNSLIAAGKAPESYSCALRAINLSRQTFSRYFFEHYACMSAAATGDYRLSAVHAEKSLLLKPDFASPRRYQVALFSQKQDEPNLRSAVAMMRRLESNFEIEDLLRSHYPTNTLRRLPLSETIM